MIHLSIKQLNERNNKYFIFLFLIVLLIIFSINITLHILKKEFTSNILLSNKAPQYIYKKDKSLNYIRLNELQFPITRVSNKSYSGGNYKNDRLYWCIPDDFLPEDYKLIKYQYKDSNSYYYKLEPNLNVASVRIYEYSLLGTKSIRVFEFICGVNALYSYEFLEDGQRLRIINNIHVKYKPSTSKNFNNFYISYTRNNYKNETEVTNVIYNSLNDTLIELPKIQCVWDEGFWSNGYLITLSSTRRENIFPEYYEREICVWNANGELLYQATINLNFIHGSPGGQTITDQIGFMEVNNKHLFYIYGVRDDKCKLFVSDVNNLSESKTIFIAHKDEPLSPRCSPINLDFSKVDSNLNNIKYSLNDSPLKYYVGPFGER